MLELTILAMGVAIGSLFVYLPAMQQAERRRPPS